MFVGTNKELLGNVHLGGLESDVKFLRTQLRGADVTAGWQFVMMEIYHRSYTHWTFVCHKRIYTFAIASKCSHNVRNMFMTNQGL